MAIKKAAAIVFAISDVFLTTYECLTIGNVTPKISTSWNASVPIKDLPTCPVIHTIATESIWAVAIPVTKLVAPGPDVTINTPVFPVDLA